GLLGQTVRANPGKRLSPATKIPPMNREWPAPADSTLKESYPPDHVEEYVHRSLRNADLQSFDLIQFHTWNDEWLSDDRWFYGVDDLRSQKLINAIGISLNRWEPWNGVRAVKSGKIDAVQVVYNIFDQNPEDELFPACEEMDVAVIARVPFDEGSLTGKISADTRFPDGDFRAMYFAPEKLGPIAEHVEALRPVVPEDSSMAEMSLRFILSHP